MAFCLCRLKWEVDWKSHCIKLDLDLFVMDSARQEILIAATKIQVAVTVFGCHKNKSITGIAAIYENHNANASTNRNVSVSCVKTGGISIGQLACNNKELIGSLKQDLNLKLTVFDKSDIINESCTKIWNEMNESCKNEILEAIVTQN